MIDLKNYKAPKATKFEKFLWWSCGADKTIMKDSMYADYAKYSGLGGIVLATGILACLAMGFAMFRVFETLWVAIPVGILWGLIIFNLDRFIVSSTGKGDGKHNISWGEFVHAIPRIIMAALIGITISAPLEVYIFQKEVDKQWEVIKTGEITRAQAAADTIQSKEFLEFEKKINTLVAEKTQNQNRINELNPQIDYEIRHGGCKEKCKEYQAERSLKLIKIKELDDEIKLHENGKKTILKLRQDFVKNAEVKNSGKLGLLDSMRALHEYPGSTWPTWMLRLLFMFIEIAPVFFKLMIAYSPYDFLSDNLKAIILAEQGIEAKEGYSKLEEGEIHDKVTYHEAETTYRQRKMIMDLDLELSKKVTDELRRREMKKIEENLDYYVEKKKAKENDEAPDDNSEMKTTKKDS